MVKFLHLEKELKQMEAEVNGKQGERLLREEVTEDEIAKYCGPLDRNSGYKAC